MSQRPLGIFAAVFAIVLLAESGWTLWLANGLSNVEAVPGTPFPTAEDAAWAKAAIPKLRFVALEGFVFGVLAIVCSAGLLLGKAWAPKFLFITSIALTLTAVVAIYIAPHQWDTQAIFILWCVFLGWAARKQLRA
jgi:uncharacterized membrane protein